MLGEYPEDLEIEHEVIGCPLCPQIAISLIGQCVIAAIDFDYGELAGIVLKASLGRARRVGIEASGTDECWISP